MNQNWEKAYYYDEDQDLVYINQDRLTKEDMLSLMNIIGFDLMTDDETGEHILMEVRYGDGDVFDESFKTIQEAFNRLDAYFDDSLYVWVTDETYPTIWQEYQ